MFHSYFLPFKNFTLTLGAVHLKCEDCMNVALNVFFFFQVICKQIFGGRRTTLYSVCFVSY